MTRKGAKAMPATSAIGDRGSRGFTLIELLVALAIMVLIAASVPTALSRMLPSRRVTVAADRLMTDLQWLQSESIRQKTRGRLALDAGGYRLEVGGISRNAQLAGTTRVSLRARTDGPALQGLLMFPDGSAQPARIVVMDSGRKAELDVGMLTGRVDRLR